MRLLLLVATLGPALPCRGEEFVCGGAVGDGSVGPADVPSEPPLIRILQPEPGAEVEESRIVVKVRASDLGGVARVVIDREDVPLSGATERSVDVARVVELEPGPRLIRIEAVDAAGNASFAELAVARTPFLAVGEAAPGAILEIGGSAGYRLIAEILEPHLAGAPRLLDRDVKGHEYASREPLGDTDVKVTVEGRDAKLEGPFLRLLADDENIQIEVATSPLEVEARGRLKYPSGYGTATFQSVVHVKPSVVRAQLGLAPDFLGRGIAAAVEGFSCELGKVEVKVSPFYDPLDVREKLVDFLAERFQSELTRQLQDAVEEVVRSECVPRFASGLAGLAATPWISPAPRRVDIEDFLSGLLESRKGLTVLLDAACEARKVDRFFPPYPGSRAEFAPYPGFPLDVVLPHESDAVLSISSDTINQLLAETTAATPLAVEFDLDGIPAPFPMTVRGAASAVTAAFLTLEGISPEEPLGLRIELRQAPVFRLCDRRPRLSEEEAPELPPVLLPEGSEWLIEDGGGMPPSDWFEPDFDDAAWVPAESGFALVPDESGLPADVHTILAPGFARGRDELHLRGRLELKDPSSLVSPLLRVQHSGKFTAYLNGEQIAEDQANPRGQEPGETGRTKVELRTADIELAPFRHLLVPGTNVVAIEGSGSGLSRFVLVPEIFDRVPEAIVPVEPEGTADRFGAGALGASSWLSPPLAELELSELEVAFVAGKGKEAIDLFAVNMRLRLETRLELTDHRLALWIDMTDGEDADLLPDAILGGIDIEVV